jgi:hypothetical protein
MDGILVALRDHRRRRTLKDTLPYDAHGRSRICNARRDSGALRGRVVSLCSNQVLFERTLKGTP